jgi:hypothetical protein
MRRRPTAAAPLVLALALAACGGRPTAPSDAACAERAGAVRALRFPSTGGDLMVLGVRVNALEEREQVRLARIETPKNRQVEMAAFIRSIDVVQRANAVFRDAFIRSDAADLARATTTLTSARSASNTLAVRLGLSCRH